MNNQFLTSQIAVYNGEALKARVIELYTQLASEPSLEPSTQINEVFSELVGLVLSYRNKGYIGEFSKEEITSIRALCMKGEFLLEQHWAEMVRTSSDAWKTLQEFPYYANYVGMAALEYPFIKGKEVTFIGSGPLPLSAIVLVKEYGLRCIGIEKDFEAYSTSTQLIGKLGLHDCIQIVHSDILNHKPTSGSVIILGAAVGETTEEKYGFMELLSRDCTSGTSILVRTAEDIVQLLYATLPDEPIESLTHVAKELPPSSIVNSLSVYST